MTTGDPLLDFALSLRSGALTPLMKAISDANSTPAYIGLIVVVYWLFSRQLAMRLLLVDAVGTTAAVILKDTLQLPRPPNSGESAWLSTADGYGFPSGHTTGAATTWSALAALNRSWRLLAFGALVTLAVGFSRLYLGVHYSRDVAGGVAIGVLLGLFLIVGLARVEAAFAKLPRWAKYASVLTLPALLAVNSSGDAIRILCSAAGAAAGHLVANQLGWIVETGDLKRLPYYGMLRLAIGLPVIVGLTFGLGSFDEGASLFLVLRFTVLGLFVTLLGPRLFLAVETWGKAKDKARAPAA
jgi:membrane-associated phospholipid phosphatase